jgi:hypothetical protein
MFWQRKFHCSSQDLKKINLIHAPADKYLNLFSFEKTVILNFSVPIVAASSFFEGVANDQAQRLNYRR